MNKTKTNITLEDLKKADKKWEEDISKVDKRYKELSEKSIKLK